MNSHGGQIVPKFLAAMLVCRMFLASTAPCLVAQEPAGQRAQRQFDYTNTDNCILCHSDSERMKDHADFVGVAPGEIWSKHDKHSQSFQLLKEKSRGLTNQILGFDLREAFADDELTRLSDDAKLMEKVKTVQSCLRCHVTWPVGAGTPTDPVEDLSRGVSCQACHGPAGEWVEAHTEKWWRRVSHEAKSRLGFTNVRDPVVKAELCTSCHVGSIKEERFVKHEWYAAGHPPLPGFELATFSEQMPLHWKPLKEKEDFAGRTENSPPVSDGKARRTALQRRNIEIPDSDLRANYRAANFPIAKEEDDPFANLPRTQEVLISGSVVLNTYVKLTGDYAQEAAHGNKQFKWPEFALYDCAACHHELRRREGLAERPARRGPPGRPPMARWPNALIGLAAERRPDLDVNFRELEIAFTERPFGDPRRIAAAAQNLSSQLDLLCQELRLVRCDEERAKKILAALVSPGETADFRDYASARQIAWAIQALRKDQERIPYGLGANLSDQHRQALQQIEMLFCRDKSDELLLVLPARQYHSVVDGLPTFLQAMEKYDADWFAGRLKVAAEER
jgi:hypothetical protein